MTQINIDLKKKEITFTALPRKERLCVGNRLRYGYMCNQCYAIVADKLGHAQYHIDLFEWICEVRDGKIVDLPIELNARVTS